ncbi:MAG: serine/threonine protein kinase, partial [Anaerolineae bacterium]|nr:serine/threonine protein kinase [Anaerolineae bacterium]
MIGQTLNSYKIISLLGEGAMGEVYKATDERTGQQVAIKILARQLTAPPEALERFRREAETLRQLDHPNIVKFVDAFEHEGQFVIVMEYIAGGSLHELIKAELLPIERARQIALDLCDALIRAHRLNIIHRDIKPENILLTQGGTPKLADF